MTIAKSINKTLDISVEDVRIDLTATIKSYDLTDTQFIFEIKSSNGTTVNLTGSTAKYIVEYAHNSQTYAIQGDVNIIGTDTLSFNLPEDLKGYSGTVLIGIYVKLTDGTKIDIKDIAVRIEPSIMDKGIDFTAKTYFEDFETVKAEVISEGEKVKTQISAVVSDVNGYADSQKQAIHNIVNDVQSTGETAKADINATLPTLKSQVSQLSESIMEISDGIGYSEIYGNNRCENSKVVIGKTILSDGSIGDNPSYALTDFMYVGDLDSVIVGYWSDENRSLVPQGTYYTTYDKDKKLIGTRMVSSKTGTDVTNAKYIRCVMNPAYTSIWMCVDSNYYPTKFTAYVEPIKEYGSVIEERIDKKYKETKVVVTVGTNKDYANLRECFEAIEGFATSDKHYKVMIDEGIYDISSLFTSSEKSASGFRGLYIPDFVYLEGVGAKENTVLKWENSDYNENISTLNMRNSCGLKNITIMARKLRYCIHDDEQTRLPNGTTKRSDQIFENVDFYHYDGRFTYCFGSGQKGNADWKFINCTFNGDDNMASFIQHNNVSVNQASYLTFDNCRFNCGKTHGRACVQFASMTNDTSALTYVAMRGCKVNGKILLNENSTSTYGAGIVYKVTGFANVVDSVDIVSTDGHDYSANVDLI